MRDEKNACMTIRVNDNQKILRQNCIKVLRIFPYSIKSVLKWREEEKRSLFIYHILRGLPCKSLYRKRCKGCCSEKVNSNSKSTVGKEEEEMKKRYISYQGKLTLIFAVMSVSVMIAFASVQLAMEQKNLTQTLYRTVQTENQKNAVALSNVLESVKDLSDALVLNETA